MSCQLPVEKREAIEHIAKVFSASAGDKRWRSKGLSQFREEKLRRDVFSATGNAVFEGRNAVFD